MSELRDTSKVQKLKLQVSHDPVKINVVTQIVDLMEEHKVSLSEMLDEWYLRRI